MEGMGLNCWSINKSIKSIFEKYLLKENRIEYNKSDGVWVVDEDGNQIYHESGGDWFFYNSSSEYPWTNYSISGATVPTSGWAIYSNEYGCANFPVSVAVTECAGSAPIPTLSQWGIIALALVMLVFGIVVVRQRKAILG